MAPKSSAAQLASLAKGREKRAAKRQRRAGGQRVVSSSPSAPPASMASALATRVPANITPVPLPLVPGMPVPGALQQPAALTPAVKNPVAAGPLMPSVEADDPSDDEVDDDGAELEPYFVPFCLGPEPQDMPTILALSSRGGVLPSPQALVRGNPGPSSVEEDARRPFCNEILLGSSARAYLFHTRSGWASDAHLVSDYPKAPTVMGAMRARGSFTAVVMPAGLNCMSIVGRDGGCKEVMDVIREECASSSGSSYLFCTGAFFIQPWEEFEGLRLDMDQPPLAEEDVRKMALLPVGPSSLYPDSPVMPAKCQRKYYAKVTGDDGSYLHSAPNLRAPIPHDPYPPELRYFESDAPPHRDRVPTIYSYLPGKGLSTSNQPNERLALVTLPDRTRVVAAYTSVRADGLRAHELRHLLDTFLGQYLPGGPSVADAAEAVNLDGGASIFIAWYDRRREAGGMQVLAKGNIGGVLKPEGDEHFRFRPMGSMLKFELK